jgi:bacteriocin biosynthesis cyclodehydratase domain-containing protein
VATADDPRELSAEGLESIRLDDGRVVLKRGINELLLSGPSVESLVEPLIDLLTVPRSPEELVAAFPQERREEVQRLLALLLERHLVRPGAEPAPDGTPDDPLQRLFYDNFGSVAAGIHQKLRACTVLVVGVTLVARSLVRGLTELGIGSIELVDDPILRNRLAPSDWVDEGNGRRLLPELPDPGEAGGASLVCATSDLGAPDALLEANRLAIAARVPFLPAWVSEMIGYVGPLNHPGETACLRCYQLRLDSNDTRREITQVVRARTGNAHDRTGLLPPMAAVVGEIAAVEVVKALGGFAPADAVGRQIEINLVSFAARVRRVLKAPRCPECSDVMARTPVALVVGPRIPYREDQADR